MAATESNSVTDSSIEFAAWLLTLERVSIMHLINQSEQSRLDLQHQIWLLAFSGSLTAPCMPRDCKPRSVLEIGCGSGAWATSYALENPTVQVTATDVTPPTLPSPPKNLTVVADNAEHNWSFNDKFDYIHIRLLTLAIRDWPAFFRRCWDHLNPGGWIELADASTPYRAENPAINCENSVFFLRVGFLYYEALLQNGIDMMAAHHHTDRLKLQGFVNIHQEVAKWPTNGKWQSEERLKTMGDMVCKNWSNMSRTITPKVFQTTLKMDSV